MGPGAQADVRGPVVKPPRQLEGYFRVIRVRDPGSEIRVPGQKHSGHGGRVAQEHPDAPSFPQEIRAGVTGQQHAFRSGKGRQRQ